MELFVKYLNGTVEPAVLLSSSFGRLRVARPGCDDATEFTFAHGQWLGEDGNAVQIRFYVPSGEFFEYLLRVAEVERETAQQRMTSKNDVDSRHRPGCARKEVPAAAHHKHAHLSTNESPVRAAPKRFS